MSVVPGKDTAVRAAVKLRNVNGKHVSNRYNTVTKHRLMFAKKEKATAACIGLDTNSSECCSKQHPHTQIDSHLKTEWAAGGEQYTLLCSRT